MKGYRYAMATAMIMAAWGATNAFQASAQNYYDEIVNAIVESNGALKAQRQEANAQRLENADENALSDPSVEFSRVWGRHGIGNKLQLDISQEFEWPGVYSVRKKASEYGLSAAIQETIGAELDMATEIRMLLNELVYVRQQINATNALLDNYNLLSKTVEKEMAAGELTAIDQRKIAIEGYKITNDMTDLRIREEQIEGALRGYTTAELDLKGVTHYPLQQLLAKADYMSRIAEDPGVSSLALTAQQEEYNARTASMKRMPNISVGYQHQAEMGDRFNGFTAGINLPVFAGRHAKRAAMERKEAAELNRETLIAKKTAEVETLYDELNHNRTLMAQYNEVFGDNKYLELLLKAYKGGQIGMHEYISEMQYYNEVTMTYLTTEYNYQQALTAINRYSR